MKRILIIISILFLVAGQMWADGLTAVAVHFGHEDRAEITLSLQNENVQWNSYQFVLSLPEGLEWATDNDGKFLYQLSARHDDSFVLTVNQQEDGRYAAVCYSPNGNLLTGTEGALLSLTIQASESLRGQLVPAEVSEVLFSTSSGEETALDNLSIEIHVTAPLVVTASSYERDYGDPNPTFEFTVTGPEMQGTPVIFCEATSTSPVGTYPIVVSRGSVENYNDHYVNGTLTINKVPLTITVHSTTKKQGDPMPEFTVTYSGFKNGETEAVLITPPTITCGATAASPNGTYPITISGAEAENYEITYVNGTLTVMDADAVLVTANSYTREYGDPNPAFEYTVVGADLEGAPVITCEATATSPVGTYPIVITKGSITNFNDSYVNGTLTITKAPLTITVQNDTLILGDQMPDFTVTYTGFKNGETTTALTTQPTITCEATADSPVGTYPITVSGAEAQNYEITYVNGTLTVQDVQSGTILYNGMTFLITNAQTYELQLIQAGNIVHAEIPASIAYLNHDWAVTAVADNVFSNHAELVTVTVPASVTTFGKDVFVGCLHLAAVTWEAPMKMTREMMGDISNPNLLFYAADVTNALDGATNVINLTNKRASHIVLSDPTDTSDTNDFFCPVTFTADEISYTHRYSQQTEDGTCRGWDALALPFDVTSINHATKGAIQPFGSLEIGHELDEGNKPFWLYEFTTRGRFVEAASIRANVPYIISMPNEPSLWEGYNLKGDVTFSATNATVQETTEAVGVTSGDHRFLPNFRYGTLSEAYLLNVGQEFEGHVEGSVFAQSGRAARPFEAYFDLGADNGVKSCFEVFDSTDGVRPPSISPQGGRTPLPNRGEDIYDLSGRTVITKSSSFTQIPSGVYIQRGKKVLVR